MTAYDDGTMPGEWGTDAIDDEGTPCQATRVIDEGELCFYLYDLTARAPGRRARRPATAAARASATCRSRA